MTLFRAILLVHVAAGAVGLVLGPVALRARKARGLHARAGEAYHWAAKRRWPGWLPAHITGQGGSYIAMVRALLVVNWESVTGVAGRTSPWAWALPTLVGSPIIAWVTYEVRLGRRPRL